MVVSRNLPNPSRVCICGQDGVAWVLVMVSYPMETRPGYTKGRYYCTKHLAELEDQLTREKFA